MSESENIGATELLEAGFGYLRRNCLVEAEIVFAKVLGTNPQSSGAAMGLGVLAKKRRNLLRARQWLSAAIHFDRRNALAYQTRGHFFLENSFLEFALADLNSAIALGIGGFSLFLRAELYRRLSQCERALGDNARYIECVDESDLAEALLQKSHILIVLGDYQGALNESIRATNSDPRNYRSLATSGFISIFKGDAKAASEFLLTAYELDSTSTATRRLLALACLMLGDYESARRYSSPDRGLAVADASLHLIHGISLFRAGNQVGALHSIDSAIQLESDFFDAYDWRSIVNRSLGNTDAASLDYRTSSFLRVKRGMETRLSRLLPDELRFDY